VTTLVVLAGGSSRSGSRWKRISPLTASMSSAARAVSPSSGKAGQA